jgi:cell division protein FtsL
MPDIQSLTTRANELGQNVDWWNIALLWALVVTAIAAIAAAIATRQVIVKSGRLAEVQAEIIAAINEKAGGANERAATANERAEKLEKDAAELTAKNLQLEAMIAPRRLRDSQLKELGSLTEFKGRLVQIKSYAMDTEGLVLATQIAEALAKSKITILDNRLTIIPGGEVIAGIVVEGPDSALTDKLRHALSANGGALNTELPNAIKRGFPANIQFGDITGGLSPAATVTVGVKPVK